MKRFWRQTALIAALALAVLPCWSGVDFDGASTGDQILVSHDTSLVATSAVTISIWFKTDQATQYGLLFGKSNSATHSSPWYDYGLLQLGHSSRVIQFKLDGGEATSLSGEFSVGTWHHIVGTWDKNVDGGSIDIFLDGSEVSYLSHGTQTTDIVDGGQDAALGAVAVSQTSDTYDGKIAQITGWNVRLSDEQIMSLADSKLRRMSLQIQPDNLMIYLPLDDEADGTSGDGDTFRDGSGNGNDGTGDDGANNTGLTAKAEEVLSYP